MFLTQTVPRQREIVEVLLRNGWDYMRRLVTGGKTDEPQLPTPAVLKNILVDLGPVYIKLGQLLSTRPDLLSASYIDELSTLQDEVPPVAWSEVEILIRKQLKAPLEEVFTSINPVPVAAGSIAQTHKAVLVDGREAALKVQRPGIDVTVSRDISLIEGIADLVARTEFGQTYEIKNIANEFCEALEAELDFIREASFTDQLRQNFSRSKWFDPNKLVVAKIFWEWTTDKLLVMEWLDGEPILSASLSNNPNGKDVTTIRKEVTSLLFRAFSQQLYIDGFFHADPHPGNLLATPDGKLAYLDFGMMSEIQPPQRYGLIEAIVHVVNRDFEGLAKDYVKLDFLTPDVDLTPIIPAFANVFADAQGASVAELNIKSITDELSALMYEYPFRVPPYYALIIRSLVTLEGIAIYIDPNFKVLSEAYPYVAKRLLTDQAPQLRTSLQDLLFKDGTFRWNRLENLLKNARNSQDYDFDLALSQGVDFLSSERGSFIRQKLVDEAFKGMDAVRKNALHNFTFLLRERVGVAAVNEVPAANKEQQETLEHIKRILGILQETRGFDSSKLINQAVQMIANPGVQR